MRKASITHDKMLNILVDRITSIRKPHPVRVAIDGIDAAGKTTLAKELAEFLSTSRRTILGASIDNFNQPREIR
jgi:uridine kinase